jgi:copper chaperone CopZ
LNRNHLWKNYRTFSSPSEQIAKWNFGVFQVSGMHCASCVKRVETAAESSEISGKVQRVDVNLATGKAYPMKMKGDLISSDCIGDSIAIL